MAKNSRGIFNSRSNANLTILEVDGRGDRGGLELVPGAKNQEIGSLKRYIKTTSSIALV